MHWTKGSRSGIARKRQDTGRLCVYGTPGMLPQQVHLLTEETWTHRGLMVESLWTHPEERASVSR
ncbi:hypothetical protein [Parapedobacter lycopersici]|uniref:hypothetical protein n=1 Tax=Parapedobacter lycopersici TaxID=1864939 RepID=UPI00333E5E14